MPCTTYLLAPNTSGTVVDGKRYSFADASGYWSGGLPYKREYLQACLASVKMSGVGEKWHLVVHLHGRKYQCR